MKITCLVENTSSRDDLSAKHGLSFYIETSEHKILFDLGSDHLFLENARKLGIDISAVDTVIISHGHFDHGGALKLFLQNNDSANIYIRKSAFDKHAVKVFLFKTNIGLDNALINHEQIIFTDDIFEIDKNLVLFTAKKKSFKIASSNRNLYKSDDSGQCIQDDFFHEQSLIITENNRTLLIGGCAHSGIVNILENAYKITDYKIDTVISGFHLFNSTSKKREPRPYMDDLSSALRKLDIIFYTCHCTGQKAYQFLKNELGKQLHYIAVGDILEL